MKLYEIDTQQGFAMETDQIPASHTAFLFSLTAHSTLRTRQTEHVGSLSEQTHEVQHDVGTENTNQMVCAHFNSERQALAAHHLDVLLQSTAAHTRTI